MARILSAALRLGAADSVLFENWIKTFMAMKFSTQHVSLLEILKNPCSQFFIARKFESNFHFI